MSMRPTIEEIEKDYKNYLIKLKGYGLCFLAKDDCGDVNFYNKSSIETGKSQGIMALDNTLYNYHDDNFIACAIVKCEYEMRPIEFVMNNEKNIVWDWTDEPVEMTLSEVCEALGKNIKIIKE